jgi:hypothetical protein
MSINVKGYSDREYSFEGPYSSPNYLSESSGVYLILCKVGDEYYPIDVGESHNVKWRIKNHERTDCWQKNCKTQLFAVYYTPNKQQAGRKEIEQDIRNNYNFPCGER